MTVTLPTEVEAYLQERVSEGGFATPEEVLIAAVELLREKEARLKKAKEELRGLLDEGIRDIEAGRYRTFDQSEIETIIARAKERRRLREESES